MMQLIRSQLAKSIAQIFLPALPIIFILVVGVAVLSRGIDESPLIDWDEATYAQVAHEAVLHHSYVDFTWNGQSYLRKPPLLFWAIAASFNTFGESECAARLPSVMMGAGTLLLMYAIAAVEFGWLAGVLAGLLPLGFYFFVARGGRECATDAPLIFFSAFAIFALGRARLARRWAPLVGAACGLAILSKGAAGLIPLFVVVIALLAVPPYSEIGTMSLVTILAITTAVAAPWFTYQAIHNGSAFWTTYIKHENLMRFVHHLEDKPAAAGFTAHSFLNDVRYLWPVLLPLSGLTRAASWESGRRMLPDIPAPVKIWLLWFAVAFSAALAVQTKLGWYVLPALMPIALIAAAIVAAALLQTGAEQSYCPRLAVTALLLLPLTAAPQWSRNESTFALQRARSRPSYEMAMRALAFAAIKGGGELYFAGIPLPTTVYYTGLRCHFVAPSEPEFELADLGGNPISVGYHELVIRDPGGTVTAVDNYDEEWNESGPISERAHTIEAQDNSAAAQDVQPAPD
jgi:4-amino-4-deoxy-L-arabinose transferase-like glycosyltransferase